MANEVVERVARAIEEAALKHGWATGSARELTEVMALAAIRALREPTPEMIDAWHYEWGAPNAANCWRSMIDAILSQEVKNG